MATSVPLLLAGRGARVVQLRAGDVALKEPAALLLDKHAGAAAALGARAPFADDLLALDDGQAEEVGVLGADMEEVLGLRSDDLGSSRHGDAVKDKDGARA